MLLTFIFEIDFTQFFINPIWEIFIAHPSDSVGFDTKIDRAVVFETIFCLLVNHGKS